jgi:hypothetical protein
MPELNEFSRLMIRYSLTNKVSGYWLQTVVEWIADEFDIERGESCT